MLCKEDELRKAFSFQSGTKSPFSRLKTALGRPGGGPGAAPELALHLVSAQRKPFISFNKNLPMAHYDKAL